MVIDVHTHIFPDAIAGKAMDALTESSGEMRPFGDGTLSNLLKMMDATGIDLSCIANIATKPAQSAAILDWSLSIQSSRILPLGSVHPKSPSYTEEINAFKEAGFLGIKLHPMYQDFHLDDQWILPFFQELERSGMFVLLHGGRDIAYPGAENASPKKFRTLLDRVPSLRIIAAHLGGWQSWKEVETYLAGANCWLDTSFITQVEKGLRERIFQRHGIDRILFGSDFPWQNQKTQMDYIRSLPLSSKEVDLILYKNAQKLFSLIP